MGWVIDSLGPEGVANAEAIVTAHINATLAPKSEQPPLPWSA